MGIDVSWRSQGGMRTSDNRDHGGVGIGGHEALCVIADGSTTAPDSGALARAIIRALVDWYVAYDQVITKQTLLAQLALIHRDLSTQHPRASASYLIVYIGKGGVRLVLHAGDCLLGRVDDNGAVEWLTMPHTLPNAISHITIAEIIALSERHRLTRSFRYREYIAPDVWETSTEGEFLLATDGFWADLRAQDQVRFIAAEEMALADDGDDRSILRVRCGASIANGMRTTGAPDENFYVRSRC